MEVNESPAVQNPRRNDDSDAARTHPLHERIAAFPHLPGVYLFKGDAGTVLYVGKAIDLRKRVGSYFRAISPTNVKTRVLLEKASDLEFVVTSTEKEALLLEASLIKKHRPRYNVVLRDDKNYPAIRIDPREDFPRIEVVRRFQKDGALYFGPYHSAHAMRETLRLLNQLFPLRHCRGRKLIPRERPCLNYSLGRCLGGCAGKISREDYRKMVDEVILFLQGKTDVLQRQLKQRMEEAAEALEFERAAFYRDRIKGIGLMLEKQHVVSDRFLNQDVLGIHQGPEGTEVAVLFVRQGSIVGQRNFDLAEAQGEPDELLAAFIQQFYEKGRHIPDEIVVPTSLEAHGTIEEWLSESKGKRVRIWPPKRGDRKRLAELAQNNALERYASRRKWEHRDHSLLESLQRILKLPRVPARMACVDISNIQGLHAVGAIVVFDAGQPDKSSYRRFLIRGKDQPDDPAMMAEVMERFFKDDPELAAGLDLLAVDGGKSQLNRIHQLMKDLGIAEHLPLISIAKEKESDVGEKGRGLYEKIYLPGRKNPIFLTRYQDILHLLQRLRDEAHRFAISHYQSRHRSDLLTSVLDTIPGVGPRRRQILLQHFGSVEALERADVEGIKSVPGIPESLAAVIVNALKQSGQAEGAS
jgi:excinuclease ABC subunit C